VEPGVVTAILVTAVDGVIFLHPSHLNADAPDETPTMTLTTEEAADLSQRLARAIDEHAVTRFGDHAMLRHLAAMFQDTAGGQSLIDCSDQLGIDYLPLWDAMSTQEQAAWSAIAGATVYAYLLFVINRPVFGLALASTLQGLILRRAFASPN
jgi:hypothetical protein